MNTLIIYSSQTGFTKHYAYMINDILDGQVIEYKDACKKTDSFFSEFEGIIFGGWTKAGRIVDVDWFLTKAKEWKDKKLAVYCCGATPNSNSDIAPFLDRVLSDEQKTYIKAFYCQAGINYKKMKFGSRLAMKAFVTMLHNKTDKNQSEIDMMHLLEESFDNSDPKYARAVADYILGK